MYDMYRVNLRFVELFNRVNLEKVVSFISRFLPN